jgi:hypothetical protein
MVMPANFSLPAVGTPEMVAERDRLRHEESERVAAYYKERDQQRHEHEAKEAGDAFAQQITERNRQLGRR